MILEENDCRYGHQKESYKQRFLTINSVHYDDNDGGDGDGDDDYYDGDDEDDGDGIG